jgi:hypothetical protein
MNFNSDAMVWILALVVLVVLLLLMLRAGRRGPGAGG